MAPFTITMHRLASHCETACGGAPVKTSHQEATPYQPPNVALVELWAYGHKRDPTSTSDSIDIQNAGQQRVTHTQVCVCPYDCARWCKLGVGRLQWEGGGQSTPAPTRTRRQAAQNMHSQHSRPMSCPTRFALP